MNPRTLDHVALWVEDRDRIADFVTRHLGMHVIDRTERFTLVGADARRGKLTLFAADGPRQQGALKHVGFRVSDLDRALDGIPKSDIKRVDGRAYFQLGEGLSLALVEAPTDSELDLDHAALYSADPETTAEQYERLGFRPSAPGASGVPRVEVGGAWVEFHQGDPSARDKPLLNHLAVLVDSAQEHIEEAKTLGIEIDDIVDAENTYAVFLRGPEGVRVEYVEHKPTFSLV